MDRSMMKDQRGGGTADLPGTEEHVDDCEMETTEFFINKERKSFLLEMCGDV